MSTYLLAYIVSEFKNLERIAPNGVLVRIWTHSSFPFSGISPNPRDILVLIHSHLCP